MSSISTPFIDSKLISASDIAATSPDFALGLQCIGQTWFAAPDSAPTQHIAMSLLGDYDANPHEFWLTNVRCRSGRFQDISFRATETLLFGVIEIDESELDPDAEQSVLSRVAENAYRQIFSLLESESFPHLWRTWNYLPNIHAQEGGLERYRQFNIGRHRAFVDCDRPVDSSPAASALGTRASVFSVAFIAGRIEPTRIENPRQVSAFAYPSEYGPRSPTFTRAAVVSDDSYEAFFISGTASIIGHETAHCGDAVAQTQETVVNLTALLEQANLHAHTSRYSLQDLHYRVYIRHAEDYERVRATLEALTGGSTRALYVQADICRQDLLLEIEAFAVTPLNADNA